MVKPFKIMLDSGHGSDILSIEGLKQFIGRNEYVYKKKYSHKLYNNVNDVIKERIESGYEVYSDFLRLLLNNKKIQQKFINDINSDDNGHKEIRGSLYILSQDDIEYMFKYLNNLEIFLKSCRIK